MFSRGLFVLAACAASALSQSVCNVCNNDSCLQGVLSAPAATADCAAFLNVVVNPAVSATILTVPTVATFGTTTITEISTVFATQVAFETVTSTLFASVSVVNRGEKRQAEAKGGPLKSERNVVVGDLQHGLRKRQNAVIPQYAAACGGAAAYSSACSCLGFTPATTTLPAVQPTITTSGTALVLATQQVVLTSTITQVVIQTTTVEAVVISSSTLIPVSSSTSSAPVTVQTVSLAGLDMITQWLTAHNTHRRNHTAVDLVWDTSLAGFAAITASSCVFAHDTSTGGGGYGQNIGAGVLPEQAAAVIMNLWYNNEINNFPLPYGNNNPDLSGFAGWGHFTQVVWASTLRVGCATQYCPNGLAGVSAAVPPYFTVCDYGPPGNFVGEFANVPAPLGGATVVFV